MAFGAAPIKSTKGIPAVTREAYKIASGATPKYFAMTRETGREIAIAATFMMKLVRINTKVATPKTNTSQCAFWNKISHSTAIHSAAPVFQRQKPILMAPLKSRIIFHGISSSSLTVSTLNTKNKRVEQSIIADLSNAFMVGKNDCEIMAKTTPITHTITNFSFLVIGPSSFERFLTLSLSPGIIFFSGFEITINKIHMTNTITQPIGNMYLVNSKKLMSIPVNSLNIPAAAGARAEPRIVTILPAPAAYAIPMNRDLP